MLGQILLAIQDNGGTPIIVGGFVRDKLMGASPKDVDVEVYHLSCGVLTEILSGFGKVSLVGESFGIIKLSTEEGEFDFSLPRLDSKQGKGHKGFAVHVDSNLTPKEAALRRDFTMNAIGMLPNGDLVDPFNGAEDIRNKVLRATSEHFAEDPLRVLRGFQFAARFNMRGEMATLEMCHTLKGEFNELPKERVWGEWYKWATKSIVPSMGLNFLCECGWIELYPELNNLIGVPQDPIWHPEGDAWTHTKLVCNAACEIAEREGLEGEDRAVLMLGALCHDLGKAFPHNGGTTEYENGRWRALGHDDAGVPLAQKFLESIGCLPRIIERVLPLVKEHMVSANPDINNRLVRRLSVRLGAATIKELLFLIESDHNGRPPLEGGLPDSAKRIGELAQDLKVEVDKPIPLVMGRHLLELGMVPGIEMGIILKKLMSLQLDGAFSTLEEGLEQAKLVSEVVV